MKTYTAIIPPEPYAQMLHDAALRFAPSPEFVKPVDHLHITLCYFGESYGENELPAVIDVLSKISFQPTKINIFGAAVFANNGYNHLVARVTRNEALYQNVLWQEALLNKAGLPVPPRKFAFNPHITLWRTKEKIAGWRVAEIQRSVGELPFKATGFQLIASENSAHRVLCELKL